MRRPRVLIVEDDKRLALTLQLALEGGADVEAVHSGHEALERLRQDSGFDLILSDLSMPDVPGDQLYKTLTAEKPELASRFVFMTGGAFTESGRRFLDSVPNQRLDKPFDLEAVERMIRERTSSDG